MNVWRASIAAACAAFLLSPPTGRGAAPGWREAETARARLYQARIALLEHAGSPYAGARAALDDERRELRDALAALRADRPPPPRTGLRMEAYISAVDDSPQPFWRYLPPCWTPTNRAPLLVFLHGYDPSLTLACSASQVFPYALTNAAARAGACIVAPFGRGNTDFQGIGEQDVILVINEMVSRYGCDSERVVLFGLSMGGLGAWCMGARMPHLFNAILIVSGRGDFYTWHRLRPSDVPPWQRRLIDTQFATAWLPGLTETPLLCLHGTLDDIVSFDQGRAVFDRLRAHNPRARFFAVPNGGHLMYDIVEQSPVTVAWLQTALTRVHPKSPPGRVRPGATGSRLQDAFLRPFLFVGAGTNDLVAAAYRLRRRADEWRRFAQAAPRQTLEVALVPARAALFNLFLFGEPENSPLVRRVLAEGGVTVRPDGFRIAGRDFPRRGHGLWFTGVNPFNSNRTAVVQCGLKWGAALAKNHLYNRIPDVIVYGEQPDIHGANLAVAAGYFDEENRLVWSDPPVTPAIVPPEPLPRWPELPTPEGTDEAGGAAEDPNPHP